MEENMNQKIAAINLLVEDLYGNKFDLLQPK